MLRPDQRSVEWKTDIVLKICKSGELVPETYTGSLSTTKVGLSLSEHHRSVYCEKDSACYQYELPSFVEVNAKQLLSPESDIVRSKKEVNPSNVSVKKTISFVSRRWVESWAVPADLFLGRHSRCI